MDDNVEAKKILVALFPEGWKRLPESLHITWLKSLPCTVP